MIYDDQGVSNAITCLTAILTPLLAKGLKALDYYDSVSRLQGFRFSVKDGKMNGVEVFFLPFNIISSATWRFATLRRVVMRSTMRDPISSIFLFMYINPELRLADVATQEPTVFEVISELFHNWPRHAQRLEVTFFENDIYGDGRPLAKVEIGRVSGSNSAHVALNIIEWTHTHVSRAIDDWDAHLLDLATRNSPTVLASLELNISSLTEVGLESMQRILSQSELEQLHIICRTFDPSLESHIGQVLNSVKWSTIKSFSLSGDNINRWIELWDKHGDPSKLVEIDGCLMRLWVDGSSGPEQWLSHSSELWLHRMMCLLSLVEVCLESIQMKETRDWELIQSAVDDSGATFVGSSPLPFKGAIIV